MSEEKSVTVDAMSGTEGAQLCISQFTDNYDTVRFCIDSELTGYTLMIVAEINGVPTVQETDGTALYTEYDKKSGQSFLVWHPGREVTCADGLVVYQIVAYKTENDEVVSTWYSKEGRIIVTDSIDTTPYSSDLIGSYPNLITRLILETDKVRSLANSLEESKVDKVEGKDLSENDFTDSHLKKLSGIEEGAEVNIIEKVRVDGEEVEVNENDRSVDVSLNSIRNEITETADMLHNEYAFLLLLTDDVIAGKKLSVNDYTNPEKQKLEKIEDGAQVNEPVDQTYNSGSTYAQSGKAVAQAIAKLVGSAPQTLDTLEELADALKDNADIVDVLNEAIEGKVDKVDNMGLSSNDFTDEEKEKLSSIKKEIIDVGYIEAYDINDIFDYFSSNSDIINNSKACIYIYRYAGNAWNYGYVFHMPSDTVEVDRNGIVQYFITTGGCFTRRADVICGESGEQEFVWKTITDVDQTYNAKSKNAQSGVAVAEAVDSLKSVLNPTPETEFPEVEGAEGIYQPLPNKSYNLGLQTEISLSFPFFANDGDVIYITFESGDTPTTLVTDFTNVSDNLMDLIPEANTGYEIFAKYNGSIWIANYSEYTFTGVTMDMGGGE